MSKLAIIYHSAHGHTEHIARQVQVGTSNVEGVDAQLVKAEDIARAPDELVDYDGFIFGSPTYLGGVSGPFKSFMDATGRLWRTQRLKGKLAAGFVSDDVNPPLFAGEAAFLGWHPSVAA